MTPADQDMDRVVEVQVRAREEDTIVTAIKVIDRLGSEVDRAHDDLRCAMTQLADLSGRMWQIAAPLRLALDRDDLHELDLRAVMASAVDALNDASGQPIAALAQLDATRKAER